MLAYVKPGVQIDDALVEQVCSPQITFQSLDTLWWDSAINKHSAAASAPNLVDCMA